MGLWLVGHSGGLEYSRSGHYKHIRVYGVCLLRRAIMHVQSVSNSLRAVSVHDPNIAFQ